MVNDILDRTIRFILLGILFIIGTLCIAGVLVLYPMAYKKVRGRILVRANRLLNKYKK